MKNTSIPANPRRKLPVPSTQSLEQQAIEQLYSNRLQEKNQLNGVALEKATHLLLEHYLQQITPK